MSEKEKPLPTPPGQRRFPEDQEDTPILADRIAKAAAEGRLGEFMNNEIPDSEQARTLVSMMMGMTGMLPPEATKSEGMEKTSGTTQEKDSEEEPAVSGPPEDVRQAAHAGDLETLVSLLKREHGKDSDADTCAESGAHSGGAPTIEKSEIDHLLKIAWDNGLSPDWVILRAIRLYIREYENTGRL